MRYTEAGIAHGMDPEVRDWLEILSNGNHDTIANAIASFGDDQRTWPASAGALAAFSASFDLIILAGRGEEVNWNTDRYA